MQNITPFSGKLTKFYRQPKVFIGLPSGGKFYADNFIDGDIGNLPVFGMNAMDEIMFKNPDALFTGEAVVSVIKSCIPAIRDPWKLSQIDMDTVLIGIRIATYGEALGLTFVCQKCGSTQEIDFNLLSALDYYSKLTYTSNVFVDPLTFNLRPLTYKEGTDLQIEAYRLQKSINQHTNDDDISKFKHLEEFYKLFGKLQANNIQNQIESITVDEDIISNQAEIVEFINNSESHFYAKVKESIDQEKERWKIPEQAVTCVECSHEQTTNIGLDNSTFFVNK